MTLRLLVVALAISASACSGLIDELPTTPTPVPTTETFSGTLNVNGAQIHAFFTTATGTVTATLTSLGDNPPEAVGFSMGTLSVSGACNIVVSQENAAVNTVVIGTVSSLAGSLCMRVYDVGKLTGPVGYTFTVTHP